MIKNKYLTTNHINVSIAIEEIARDYVRYGAKRLGIEDRLNRFTAYIKSRGTKCAESDVISHYVDSIFMPILQNSEQLAVAVSNRDVPRYYRNRFVKALNTRDKAFIRWFLKNYVLNYTDVDAIVSNNYQLLPWVFNYGFCVCPTTGGSCAGNAVAPCASATELPQNNVCCTGSDMCSGGNYFILVDNAPWVSEYSTSNFGITTQVPTSPGVFTLTGSVTGPSCFPSSGVTLNLDIINYVNYYPVNACASSCPSGSACGAVAIPYCPGTTRSYPFVPILYYGINLTVLPNTAYSVWWSASVS